MNVPEITRDVKTNKMQNRSTDAQNRAVTIQANFLIIREIFNMIKDFRTSNIDFWLYLLDMENTPENAEKADAHYTALIYNGSGDSMKHAKKLIEYGISAEYFNDSPEYMIADEAVKHIYRIELDENNTSSEEPEKYPLSECREVLLEKIFTIKNLDGTLVIDCMRNLLMDMYHITEPTYDLADSLIDLKAGSHLSQKNLKKYYKDVAEKFAEQLTAPELPIGKIPDKKIYSVEDSEASIFTLTIIREAYSIIADMYEINNPMKNFYEFIGISEDEYEDMLESGNIPNKLLVQKFEPYKYPASLFRGDNPTEIDVCSEIKNVYHEYSTNFRYGIEKFRHYLKIFLCYKISNDNFALIIPTCSLIEAMLDTLPYTNFLSEEDLALYVRIQLAKENSETDTEN